MSNRPTNGERTPAWTTHALEWGLGSVLLGLLSLALIPIGCVAGAFALYYSSVLIYDADSVEKINWVITTETICLMGLTGLGLIFGLVGLWQAARRSLPAAAPVTGIVVCSLALALLGLQLYGFREAGSQTLKGMAPRRLPAG